MPDIALRHKGCDVKVDLSATLRFNYATSGTVLASAFPDVRQGNDFLKCRSPIQAFVAQGTNVRIESAVTISIAVHLLVGIVTRAPMVVISDYGARELRLLEVAIIDNSQTPGVNRLSDAIDRNDNNNSFLARPSMSNQAVPPAGESESNAIARPARFITDPDFSILEGVALHDSRRISIRLLVSTIGTVDRVDAVEGASLSPELLERMMAILAQERLEPAIGFDGKPLASQLTVTINIEPGPEILYPDGGGKQVFRR